MNNRIYTIFSKKSIYAVFLSLFITSICSSQTLQDIENIRKQYQDALKNQELQKPKEIKDAEETARSTALPDKVIYTRKEVESLIANTQKLLDRLNSLQDSSDVMPYVGYNIFEVRDTIPFWQNLPTPNDYILGPGDEIIISLYGSIEQNTSDVINRDGQVFFKDVGTLNLIGMRISVAKKYIKNRYSKVYSTLLGQKPTTFLDVTLGELKSINIHVVGFAVYPGTHVIHPFSSVFSSLAQAGGVDLNGSLREIKVIREGKTISKVDLYEYLYLGKSLSNVRLLDQDVIYIPPRNSTIAITGRVKTPGYYESSSAESIQDLINFSGGFSSYANNYIYLVNNNYKNQRFNVLDSNELSNHLIYDGDSLHVPIFHSVEEYVVLKGKVKSPGRIPYKKGTTLAELLKIDGSIQDPVFKRTMNTKNISIFRRKDNSEQIQKLSIDLSIQKDLKIENDDCVFRQKGGRSEGLKTLESFIFKRGLNYRVDMSSPLSAQKSCSRISPHLAYGSLSIREVSQATQKQKNTILEGKVENCLQNLKNFRPSLIVANPSRKGIDSTVRKLLVELLEKSPSARLIYVSCCANSLQRDLRDFQNSGLLLRQLEAFDMFAGTDQIEWLGVITKKPDIKPINQN